ncbi:hypothetical protein [Halorussus ruber]|uniref:hypothetical protein n=1 Tax=Halorussus ruber TaxID=1126238 RepID=UPI001091CB90|nr:hypothetical protein [Halorussus ruber]
MTYRSASRGIMYTAPPKADENSRTDDAAEETAEEIAAEVEERAPELASSPGASDANWTGSVPADD